MFKSLILCKFRQIINNLNRDLINLIESILGITLLMRILSLERTIYIRSYKKLRDPGNLFNVENYLYIHIYQTY